MTPSIQTLTTSTAVPGGTLPCALARVLDTLAEEVGRCTGVSERDAWAIAVWVAFTHVVHLDRIGIRIAPRLAIVGQSAGAVLAALEQVVAAPCQIPGVTAARLYRTMDSGKPTVLVPGAHTIRDMWREDRPSAFQGVLNSSHNRAFAGVMRCHGKKVKTYNAFGALAFTCHGQPPERLRSRSIVVTADKPVTIGPAGPAGPAGAGVLAECRLDLARWAASLVDLPEVEAMPSGLFHRNADNWEPLMRIALAAGGHWPGRAESAAMSAIHITA